MKTKYKVLAGFMFVALSLGVYRIGTSMGESTTVNWEKVQ